MPTILERLTALFSRDMRAVLRNPRAISMIENPSIGSRWPPSGG
ncbi:hypothetical protein NXY47_00050 [Bacteroides fragilis]|nr:hypothetical protein [Bacteroides fragilis]